MVTENLNELIKNEGQLLNACPVITALPHCARCPMLYTEQARHSSKAGGKRRQAAGRARHAHVLHLRALFSFAPWRLMGKEANVTPVQNRQATDVLEHAGASEAKAHPTITRPQSSHDNP